jgi:hypothetical protein
VVWDIRDLLKARLKLNIRGRQSFQRIKKDPSGEEILTFSEDFAQGKQNGKLFSETHCLAMTTGDIFK